ncbi:hypothetical protein NNJEOMEG_00199 [Fundidesulfovibrio magnetotacticus]|uniref:Uncharacterized protein n=1 Tax=Fundidesulfovibrio magnetotacticus TaxID=2730080 RepID=A0A6V8LL08_9BACT|nr:hypothetical protein [Fundidesulfovibrio magnetotacticus]GFK92374.1 hypothetical protein NNJEOMEG_00199 [Fundidesulfovibrio magnetotacticus]
MKPTIPTILFLALAMAAPDASMAKKKDAPPQGYDQYGPPGQGKSGGPPPWAPAHGYRAKQRYRYYPAQNLYMDPASGLYYFFQGGHWRQGGLPPGLPPGALGKYREFDGEPGQPWKDNPYVKGNKKKNN